MCNYRAEGLVEFKNSWDEGFLYKGGQIVPDRNGGGYHASYLCRWGGGEGYQAQTIASGGGKTIDECKVAIDESNAAQDKELAPYSALNFKQAREQGVGATWPSPTSWGAPDVMTVVAVSDKGYILSRVGSQVYLSMGEADKEYACQFGQEQAWMRRFEAPIPDDDLDDDHVRCWECGSEVHISKATYDGNGWYCGC